MCMSGHERLHKSGRAGLVQSQSKAVESTVVIFKVPEHDLVACRKAQVVSLFHIIYPFLVLSLQSCTASLSKCMNSETNV